MGPNGGSVATDSDKGSGSPKVFSLRLADKVFTHYVVHFWINLVSRDPIKLLIGWILY
jgi:hypothetical protein